MAFILFFLGAVGASAQSNDAANPTTGRIVFIEPKGALKVRQAKRLRLCKVTAGTLVRRGYVLILDAAGRATVICGDGKKRELAPGPQGCPCRSSCTPEVCGIRYDGSTIAATRGPDTNEGAFPVVISPRKTLVANLRPTIHWTPVAGAKADTSYKVFLYGEGMKVIWTQEVVSKTRLAYPDAEPPLTPGQTYKVVVNTDSVSSEQDGSPGLGFTTLTADQARALADEKNKIKKLGLHETETRFSIANLYAAKELYSEAIEQLAGLYESMKAPAVASMLGDLYAVIGMNREAEKKYLVALKLTSANDLDGLGLIRKSLAQVYENLGIFDRAIARLREAIRAYRRLGNTSVVRALLREERRLKKGGRQP